MLIWTVFLKIQSQWLHFIIRNFHINDVIDIDLHFLAFSITIYILLITISTPIPGVTKIILQVEDIFHSVSYVSPKNTTKKSNDIRIIRHYVFKECHSRTSALMSWVSNKSKMLRHTGAGRYPLSSIARVVMDTGLRRYFKLQFIAAPVKPYCHRFSLT